MEYGKEKLRGQMKGMEQVNEMLSDALSLIILLENDMEIQKSDRVHARIVKITHEILKGIQISLSEYIGQEEEKERAV